MRWLPAASVVCVEPLLSVTMTPASSLVMVSVTAPGGCTAAVRQHAVDSAPEILNAQARLADVLSAEVIVTDCYAALAAVVLEISPASIVKVVSPRPGESPEPADTETTIERGGHRGRQGCRDRAAAAVLGNRRGPQRHLGRILRVDDRH